MSKALKKFSAVAVAIAWLLCVTGTSQARYKKDIIIWTQKSLQTLGYYKGEVSGKLDEATINAIKAFQKDHGLKEDGKPGKKTRRAIKKALRELEEKAKKEGQSGKPTNSTSKGK